MYPVLPSLPNNHRRLTMVPKHALPLLSPHTCSPIHKSSSSNMASGSLPCTTVTKLIGLSVNPPPNCPIPITPPKGSAAAVLLIPSIVLPLLLNLSFASRINFLTPPSSTTFSGGRYRIKSVELPDPDLAVGSLVVVVPPIDEAPVAEDEPDEAFNTASGIFVISRSTSDRKIIGFFPFLRGESTSSSDEESRSLT
ncbi:hypothetical protein ABW19_dt0210330 [Dactylella cylindrospora]|nr:hypothetical protein ABW19_dt0210330 [Dactylella cylindrospora]